MNITLIRHSMQPDVTLGTLIDSDTGHYFCCTLEKPWKDNKRQISCIPAGQYKCVPYSSVKFTNVWEVTNVTNRSKVLIHSGNTTDDIEGCILIGMEHGTLNNKDAVLRSKEALLKLRAENAGKSFNLTIKEV